MIPSDYSKYLSLLPGMRNFMNEADKFPFGIIITKEITIDFNIDPKKLLKAGFKQSGGNYEVTFSTPSEVFETIKRLSSGGPNNDA